MIGAKKASSTILVFGDPISYEICPLPIGAVYTQYPGCEKPGRLWKFTHWKPLQYGSISFGFGTTIRSANVLSCIDNRIIIDSNIVGDNLIVYSKGEIREIQRIEDNVLYIDSPLGDSDIQIVYIGYNSQNSQHIHEADVSLLENGQHTHEATIQNNTGTHTHSGSSSNRITRSFGYVTNGGFFSDCGTSNCPGDTVSDTGYSPDRYMNGLYGFDAKGAFVDTCWEYDDGLSDQFMYPLKTPFTGSNVSGSAYNNYSTLVQNPTTTETVANSLGFTNIDYVASNITNRGCDSSNDFDSYSLNASPTSRIQWTESTASGEYDTEVDGSHSHTINTSIDGSHTHDMSMRTEENGFNNFEVQALPIIIWQRKF